MDKEKNEESHGIKLEDVAVKIPYDYQAGREDERKEIISKLKEWRDFYIKMEHDQHAAALKSAIENLSK
jgi:hypothetical protein